MNQEEARAILGIAPGASRSEAQAAYRRQAKLFHPDVLGQLTDAQRRIAEENMARTNEAWDVLSSIEKAPQSGATTPERNEANEGYGDWLGRQDLRPATQDECQFCGCVPAVEATIRSLSTFLIWFKVSTNRGAMCRSCGTTCFRIFQSETLRKGWWGIGIIALIPILVANWLASRRLLKQTVASFRDPHVLTPLPNPVLPPPPVRRQPLNWFAPATALAVLVFLGNQLLTNLSRPPYSEQAATEINDQVANGQCWETIDSESVREVSCTVTSADLRTVRTVNSSAECPTEATYKDTNGLVKSGLVVGSISVSGSAKYACVVELP